MTGAEQALRLEPVNAGVYRVVHATCGHVGNLKRAGGTWKFKAIGYEDAKLVPGGGPFTHRHNLCFDRPDAALLAAALDAP